MKKLLFTMLIVVALVGAGCSDSKLGDSFKSTDVGGVTKMEKGKIIDVIPVEIKGDKVVGTATGAVIGAVAGAFIGGSTTVNVIMGTAGAAIGAYAGYKISGKMKDGKGYEYIIELDNGDVIKTIQTRENKFYYGDRVIVKFGEEETTLVKDI